MTGNHGVIEEAAQRLAGTAWPRMSLRARESFRQDARTLWGAQMLHLPGEAEHWRQQRDSYRQWATQLAAALSECSRVSITDLDRTSGTYFETLLWAVEQSRRQKITLHATTTSEKETP